MVSLSSPRSEASTQQQSQQVVLHSISWQTYQAMLADMGDHRSSRLAYDRGTLEITIPSDLHEFIKRLLERMVTTLTEELNLKVRSVGSVTLNREDLAQGVKPDSGFYIQNASQIRGRKLDLETDPPPDLIVEVDVTSSSLRRLEIYQRLRIPEVWRWTSQSVEIIHFQNGEHAICEDSLAFPMLPAEMIQRFLEAGKDADDDNEMIRSLQSWVREQEHSGEP
jgi:Uma2 family endonuclease